MINRGLSEGRLSARSGLAPAKWKIHREAKWGLPARAVPVPSRKLLVSPAVLEARPVIKIRIIGSLNKRIFYSPMSRVGFLRLWGKVFQNRPILQLRASHLLKCLDELKGFALALFLPRSEQ